MTAKRIKNFGKKESPKNTKRKTKKLFRMMPCLLPRPDRDRKVEKADGKTMKTNWLIYFFCLDTPFPENKQSGFN